MTWEGLIPRKSRKTFEQFLGHDDPRIRSLAEEMLKQDVAERASLRADFELEEALLDSMRWWDKKYVSHDDYQLILSAPGPDGARIMRACLGFGPESATRYSRPLRLETGAWHPVRNAVT